ncbi:MAG: peptide MFS transporter [Pirellulaceae bacterium]|nr:peptide MFS transporter [Pirellulaceae bacterium]
MSSASGAPANTEKTWFGHPVQLARLFTTEMWERFGYYGMRALLNLYLVQYFFFKDEVSSALYGAFTALVYLTPLFGGLLADRYLGYKKSVKFGAVLMACGYLGLCFGDNRADPIAKLNGETYVVEMKKEDAKDGAKAETSKFVTVNDKKFKIQGQKDGTLKLISVDGDTAADLTYAKGTFDFDGKRNPFWVNLMFLSLACVIVGNGFFKPNISTIVGTLYSQTDPRRDGGFTIFYMGINLGSMFSQLLCPPLYDAYGPWAGFALAAGGMLFSWSLFQFDGGRLKGFGEPPANSSAAVNWTIYAGAIIAVPMIWWLMNNTLVSAQTIADMADSAKGESVGIVAYLLNLPLLGKIMFILFTLAMIGVPVWAAFTGTLVEAQRMFVAIVLIVFSVVFWTLFEQAGSSLTLYADRNTNLSIFGLYEMSAGQTQFFNALFIVVFAPVFSVFWTALGRRGLEPSTPVKFGVALMLVGAGFLVLVYGAKYANADFRVPLFWLALAYLIHSIGELCLSPVGLSMITKLSMPKVVGLMMGVWFLSSAMAQYVGGIVAQFAAVETVGGEVTDPEKSLATYVGVFQTIGIWGCGIGLGLLVLSPLLKKMMHGVK